MVRSHFPLILQYVWYVYRKTSPEVAKASQKALLLILEKLRSTLGHFSK